eukprot:3234173-Prymnesium_polylepis.1
MSCVTYSVMLCSYARVCRVFWALERRPDRAHLDGVCLRVRPCLSANSCSSFNAPGYVRSWPSGSKRSAMQRIVLRCMAYRGDQCVRRNVTGTGVQPAF